MGFRSSSHAKGAAHESWARTVDRTERTRPAREAQWAALEREVDPDNRMTPEDRRKAAQNRRTAKLLLAVERSREAKRKAAERNRP
jgi:hypothetical protein